MWSATARGPQLASARGWCRSVLVCPAAGTPERSVPLTVVISSHEDFLFGILKSRHSRELRSPWFHRDNLLGQKRSVQAPQKDGNQPLGDEAHSPRDPGVLARLPSLKRRRNATSEQSAHGRQFKFDVKISVFCLRIKKKRKKTGEKSCNDGCGGIFKKENAFKRPHMTK